MINKHKSNKIKENSNTVRHLNNGTDHRHSKSCCDQSSPARRTIIPACHVRAGCGVSSVSSGTDLYLYSPSVVALLYANFRLFRQYHNGTQLYRIFYRWTLCVTMIGLIVVPYTMMCIFVITYGYMLLQVMPQDTKQENTRQNLFHHTSSIKVSDQNIHPTNSTWYEYN